MAASTVPAASVAALLVVLMLVVLLPPPPAAAASGQPPSRCTKSELSACYCGRTTYDRQELYAVNCTGTGLNMQQSIEVFLNLPSETEVLIFTGNSMPELPTNIFGANSTMDKLRFLDMSNNGIKEIKGKSYHRVSNVERLILNNNEIGLNGIGLHHPRTFSSRYSIMNEHSMYIQHDWDECIRSVENRVWISVKPRNGPSVHGHLQCKSHKLNGIPIIQGSNGFEVESVSSHAIQVKHSSCPSVTLLSPYRVFKDVHNASVTSLDVVGGQCVSASDSVLKSWSSLDHEKEKEVTMTGHYGDIYCCRWFPSVKVVLSCGADLRIKIWSSDTGECAGTLVGHTKAVTDLAIIDRGRNIISVSKDGTSKLWHVGSGKVIDDLIKLNQTTYINCCSISSPKSLNLGERNIPDSDLEIGTNDKCLLIGCENGMISLIGVYARKILATNNLDCSVNACHLNEGAQIYVGCNDGRVIWLDEQLVIRHCIFDTNSPVRCLCLFKELVVCGHGDGSCVIRSVNNKKAYLTGTNAEPIYAVSTDSRFLYTACRDGIIRKYLPELL